MKLDKNQFILRSNFTGALQKSVLMLAQNTMHTYTHPQHQRLTREMCKAQDYKTAKPA